MEQTIINGKTIFVQEKTKKGVIFPPLFKYNNNGKLMVWNVYTKKGVIHKEMGQKDGKIRTVTRKAVGKNKGRANETTDEEQAILMANKDWNDKVEEGYVQEGYVNKDQLVNKNELSNHCYRMKAHEFSKHSSKINYPCYVQRKLDGIRCIAVIKDHECSLYSSSGRAFPFFDDIKKELGTLDDVILDGELYSLTMSFEILSGVCRKQKEKSERENEVFYFSFDLINEDTFNNRYKLLRKIVANLEYTKLVTCSVANNEQDVYEKHDKYVAEGYEGIIVRNLKGLYPQKSGVNRSYDLQKFKRFEDAEFIIKKVTQGEGTEEGCAIWVCYAKGNKNKTFTCRPKGTQESRKQIYEDRRKYKGKLVTIRYQGMLTDGIPRFPVGLSLRDKWDL